MSLPLRSLMMAAQVQQRRGRDLGLGMKRVKGFERMARVLQNKGG